tara:strand:+ start:550 stop:801 length:252 start_codon:yes stop_codon:yes gene_type:complete
MMKEKPYRVTMTYLKNVAKRHRPAIYEERSKDETFWGRSPIDAERQAHARYGHQVTVKSAAILPGWADVDFSAMAGMEIVSAS